ncbi:hypothetical protein HMPREF3170_10540 [Corynebacterium sp. HMSC08D02]|nr:hypothetical protein HMPREF3170_10540 [Corynebacterium sp. HMSC08D02]
MAFAQEDPAVVVDGVGAQSTAEAYADAIHSPGATDQKGTISGSVKEIVEGGVGFGSVQDSGKPLKGVKVYAQWYEGLKTEHASPIYYTESDENGNFTLNMAPYTDAEGVERQFQADASVGETVPQRDHKSEKIRVWAELPEDLASKYRLVHQPAAGIFPPTAVTPGTQGDGVWSGNKVSEVKIQFAQKTQLPQHLPQDKWVESQGSGLYGSYQGRAFWNLDVASGALRHETVSKYDGKDVPAAGLQVVGSYLSDEAVKAINEYVKKNFAGKTLRGNGWTVDDEQGLQQWIHEQVAADPEGWIAETVKTTTDANGEFSLYWRGLWGNSWESTPGTLTPPADKLHTLAGSRDEGTFINGNRTSKHVNMDWSFVQILDRAGNVLPDNVGTLYPWVLGNWDGPNSGTYAQAFGGDGALINKQDDQYLRWNIALYPAPLKFDVLEKNTYDNWARVGETVETLTTGLPIGDGLEYFIEWTNDAGEVVKTCGPVMPDADTTIASCAVKVPADVEHGDVFTAHLYQGKDNSGTLLAQDAFAVTTSYLAYGPEDAKVGVAKESTPKFDDPDTAPVEEKLESAEFFLNEDKLPEGVTKDQVKVDPKTGVVTFTPKAGQEGKSFDIPVKMVDTAIQVPVYDDNADPVVDAEGNQVTRPRTIFHASATFKVAATPVADTVEPKYEDKLVVPGEPAESTPTFTDKDGKEVTPPEGTKFAIPEDFTAPEGYTVDIDKDGKVTVKADPEKLNGDTVEEFEVPVTVTYPDGSTDKTSAKFELDTDGDGTPDSKDDDDDNDGIKDDEEKDKGSNPKDKDSIPAAVLDPGVLIQNPQVIKDPQVVVEGQPSDPFDTAKNVPEGGKVTVDGLPDGLTVDEKSGKVTGTLEKITDWGKEEEERDVTVTVTFTDKDGKKVAKDDKVITVQRDTDSDGIPDVTDNDDDGDGVSDEQEKEAGTDPKDPNSKPENPSVVPNSNSTVPADGKSHEVSKVENPNGDETGKLVDKDGKEIPGSKVEIDKGGNVKVTVPEGTDPQDAKVIVTSKDGNKVGEIDVKIVDPRSDAAKNTPDYGDRKNVEAGKVEEVNPFEGKTGVPVKEAKGKPSAGSDDWAFKTGETNGVVEATAPDYKKVADKIDSELPKIDSSWEKFKEIFTPYVRPSVDVDFIYNDKSKNSASADFDLVGKDGKSLLDPNGDFDGDGVSNEDEIKGGSNPADETSKPRPQESEDETAPSSSKYIPVYPVSYVRAGEKGTSIRPNVTVKDDGFDFTRQPMPKGAKFSTDYKGASFDEHGALTIMAPKGVDEVVVPVTVTFADGTTATTNAKFVVRANHAAESYAPAYELGVNASPGETVLVHQTGEESLPAGTEFELVRKASDLNGWIVRVNPETGVIEATAPQGNDAKRATLAVKVSYFDGSEQTIKATVDPGSTNSMAAKLQPTKTTLEVGVGETEASNVFSEAPKGTKFALAEQVSGDGWTVAIDETTGTLTVKTDETVKPNAKRTVPVQVTLPDGSRKVVDVQVKAVKPTAPTPEPKPAPAPSGSSQSSVNGSSAGSVIGIVVGLLALIGGVGWALKMNEPQIRQILRDMGIHI